MAKLLVFNPMKSESASLTRMEISTTTHSIGCKPIIPIIHMCTITTTSKAAATTEEMKTTKATSTTKMMLTERHKINKRLGVVGKVVLIVIWKK